MKSYVFVRIDRAARELIAMVWVFFHFREILTGSEISGKEEKENSKCGQADYSSFSLLPCLSSPQVFFPDEKFIKYPQFLEIKVNFILFGLHLSVSQEMIIYSC